MVALAVRFCGQRPVVCTARPLLLKAQDALERGALIQSACHLREAIRVLLLAECDYWQCLPKPKRKKRRDDPQKLPPSVLLASLKKCEHTAEFGFDLIEEAIGYCNKLAHCKYVRRGLIVTSIEIVHAYLDSAKYLQQPTAAEGRVS